MADIQLHNTLTGKIEKFVPTKSGRSAHVHLRADGLLTTRIFGNYRTFCVPGYFAAVPEAARIQAEPRDETSTDVDDRIIANAAAAGVSYPRLHREICAGFFRRLQNA